MLIYPIVQLPNYFYQTTDITAQTEMIKYISPIEFSVEKYNSFPRV